MCLYMHICIQLNTNPGKLQGRIQDWACYMALLCCGGTFFLFGHGSKLRALFCSPQFIGIYGCSCPKKTRSSVFMDFNPSPLGKCFLSSKTVPLFLAWFPAVVLAKSASRTQWSGNGVSIPGRLMVSSGASCYPLVRDCHNPFWKIWRQSTSTNPISP